MNIPYIGDGFDIDHSILYHHDPERMCMIVRDRFGVFLPIPNLEWNEVIAGSLFPKVTRLRPDIDPVLAFYYAVRSYCKLNGHLYVGLN